MLKKMLSWATSLETDHLHACEGEKQSKQP